MQMAAETGKFQSTLPRRERLRCKKLLNQIIHFNPRSRVGSDVSFLQIMTIFVYFNPRSRVGSDVSFLQIMTIFVYFNPRSRVGSDCKTP